MEAPATLSSFVWQGPGKRVSVRLSLEVVDRLGLTVMAGFQSLPRRGLEVGGFLLGTTRREGEATVVEINKFEPLECEHSVGPSYLLSAMDREALGVRVRSHMSSSGVSMVGFYRSHTRKDFALTMEDVDLMSDFFAKPSMVFLLIHTQRGETPMAAFSIWERNEILSMTPYLPFPFRIAELTAGGYEICNRTSVFRPASEKPGETQALSLVPPAVARPESGASLLLAGPKALPRPLPQPQLPPAADVLPASQGSQNRLSPQSPPPWTDALSRTLSRFLLQARTRSSLGWPLSATILLAVALAVVLHHGFVPAENLRAARLLPGAVPGALSVPSPMTAVAPKSTAPVEPTAAPSPETSRASTPRAPLNRPRGYRSREESTIAAIAAARPSATVPNPPEMPVLPDPPELASGLPSGADVLSRDSEILKTRIPQIGDGFVSVTIDRLPKSSGGGLLRKLPLIGKRYKHSDRADFVPPTPIREVPTVIPAELRHRIQHEVPIDVKVYVDRAGKVKFAELLSEGTGSNRDLASLAVFSARKWEFLPAHVGDETVPADVVLRFRFGPEMH